MGKFKKMWEDFEYGDRCNEYWLLREEEERLYSEIKYALNREELGNFSKNNNHVIQKDKSRNYRGVTKAKVKSISHILSGGPMQRYKGTGSRHYNATIREAIVNSKWRSYSSRKGVLSVCAKRKET